MTVTTTTAPVGFAPRVAHPATSLFGLSFMTRTRADVADAIVLKAMLGQRTVANFVNAHCVNVAARDPAYRRALDRSDMLLLDGIGMRIAALLAGRSIVENLNGTDLFPALCARAAVCAVPLYLLGGQPGVAAATAAAMRVRFPSLDIAGTHDGFFDPGDETGVIDAINASGARIVLVAMGVPQQELWIARMAPALKAPVLMGVGGLFDYYSGRIPRAPALLRAVGLEWGWRFAQEPRRLARRYLIGNMTFLARAASHGFAAREVAKHCRSAVKRALDVLISATALAVFAPVFAAIAFAIRAEDRGPVFFRQTRIGRDGKPFAMRKFRSMSIDAEARLAALASSSDRDATCFKMRIDPRVTRTGRFIRRFSLDELPQLMNVLDGSMSLVGPRPALPKEVITYCDRIRGRLGGKPGITCTWQVSGRAEIPFEEQVGMDLSYLANPSLRADIALLARTIPAVVSGRGAY
jgi:exopolysaccharide biosynthesis WecB/TagA/CpsF family protein